MVARARRLSPDFLSPLRGFWRRSTLTHGLRRGLYSFAASRLRRIVSPLLSTALNGRSSMATTLPFPKIYLSTELRLFLFQRCSLLFGLLCVLLSSRSAVGASQEFDRFGVARIFFCERLQVRQGIRELRLLDLRFGDAQPRLCVVGIHKLRRLELIFGILSVVELKVNAAQQQTRRHLAGCEFQ